MSFLLHIEPVVCVVVNVHDKVLLCHLDSAALWNQIFISLKSRLKNTEAKTKLLNFLFFQQAKKMIIDLLIQIPQLFDVVLFSEELSY